MFHFITIIDISNVFEEKRNIKRKIYSEKFVLYFY